MTMSAELWAVRILAVAIEAEDRVLLLTAEPKPASGWTYHALGADAIIRLVEYCIPRWSPNERVTQAGIEASGGKHGTRAHVQST